MCYPLWVPQLQLKALRFFLGWSGHLGTFRDHIKCYCRYKAWGSCQWWPCNKTHHQLINSLEQTCDGCSAEDVFTAAPAESTPVFMPQVHAQHGAFALLAVWLKPSVLTNSALAGECCRRHRPSMVHCRFFMHTTDSVHLQVCSRADSSSDADAVGDVMPVYPNLCV